MKNLYKNICVIMLFLLLMGHYLNVQASDNKANLIVGGQEVTDKTKYPWIVSVGYDGNNFCGGALVAKDWILTAAHCVHDIRTDQLQAISGNLDLTESSTPIDIEEVIIHPDYDPYLNHNDIALLKTNQAITTTLLQIADTFDLITNINEEAMVMGWGLINSETGETSTKLHEVAIPLTILSECEQAEQDESDIDPIILESHLCFDSSQGSPCNSDSGSPYVVWDEQNTQWKAIGLVSYGTHAEICGVEFDVSPNLSHYKSWITKVTMGNYTNLADISENNNSIETAYFLTNGLHGFFSVDPNDDIDWFTVSLTETSQLIFEIRALRGDTELTLYDNNQEQVAYNDDLHTKLSGLYLTCDENTLPAGNYYLEVKSYNQETTIDRYNIFVQATSCEEINRRTDPSD